MEKYGPFLSRLIAETPIARFNAEKYTWLRFTPRGGRGKQCIRAPLPSCQPGPPYSLGQRGYSSFAHPFGSWSHCTAIYQRCKASNLAAHSPQARSKRICSFWLNFVIWTHLWQIGTAFSGRASRHAISTGIFGGGFKTKRQVALFPQRTQVSSRASKVPCQGIPANDAAWSSSRYTASSDRICCDTFTAPLGMDHLLCRLSSRIKDAELTICPRCQGCIRCCKAPGITLPS